METPGGQCNPFTIPAPEGREETWDPRARCTVRLAMSWSLGLGFD